LAWPGNFYDTEGRLQLDALPPRHVLVECSEQCACRAHRNQETCANSVVSNGIRLPLEVRPTRSSGLGLFSRTSLARGTFVCEFAGELISDRETSRRWEEYRAMGVGNYILCINEDSAEADPDAGAGARKGLRTNIDPTRRGNIA
jgi:histone-lysine N-methyltransferase SETMAR